MNRSKQYLFLGIIGILLVALPLTVVLTQKQQDNRTKAEASTTLALISPYTTVTPLTAEIEDVVTLDVMVNPGTNFVSTVKFDITFDGDSFELVEGESGFVVNTQAFPVVAEGPLLSKGRIAGIVTTGIDVTRVITKTTRVARIQLRALKPTNGESPVTFSDTSEILSAGENDTYSDNVLSGTSPISIIVKPHVQTPTNTPTPTTVREHSISWHTPQVELDADDFYIEVNGKKFYADASNVTVRSDPGTPTNTTLEVTWNENGVEMRNNYYFTYTPGEFWKVTEMRTYDGLNPGEWIDYTVTTSSGAPIMQHALGETYRTTTLELINQSTDNPGKVYFKNFRLKAFADKTLTSQVKISLFLHGLGASGDNSTTLTSLSNKNPNRKQRNAFVEAYASNGSFVATASGTVQYDTASGIFKGDVTFPQKLSGVYSFKVKTDYYLKQNIPGFFTFSDTQSSINLTPNGVSMVAANADNDTALTILDYNMIMDCYSDINPARACTEIKKTKTDATDDGKVNQFDYNLFLRELSVQNGA